MLFALSRHSSASQQRRYTKPLNPLPDRYEQFARVRFALGHGNQFGKISRMRSGRMTLSCPQNPRFAGQPRGKTRRIHRADGSHEK